MIVGDLVIGESKMVADMVQSRIKDMRAPFQNYEAIGVIRKGKLVGGIVYHDYTGHDVRASAAFDTLRWWKPGIVRALFAYPFNELKCARITIITARRNRKTRKIVERIGFKMEGAHPLGIGGREDAISYGMLRKNCTWLKEA